MSYQYELKKFLRHVTHGILREYFERIGWDSGVNWEEVTQRKVNPLFEAVQRAPDHIRARVNRDFQQINEMATEGAIQTLVDEGRERHLNLGEELQDVAGLHNKVFRVFLDYPAENGRSSLFDVAKRFNKADNLPGRSWRRRSGVPKIDHAQAPEDEVAAKLEEGRKRLAEALQSYYRVKEGRGYGCEVDHFERGERLYWFAYVRDYDSVDDEWSEEDQAVVTRDSKPVFEVIFAHSNDEQWLDIFVKGDMDTVADLRTLWARAVLGTDDLGTPPERGVEYDLNVLKTTRAFTFEPGDRIKEVRISGLRLSFIGDRKRNRRITLEANTRRDRNAVFGLMEELVKKGGLSLDVFNVTQTVISFVFAVDEHGGTKTITARITHPDSCSLKHEPKEEIARRCLRDWKIDVSPSAQPDSEGA